MRVRGEFDRTLEGVRNLRVAGVPIEINFSPASFNVHEAEQIVDLAYELGAASFYSGRTMFTGNAVKAWRHLALSDEQYDTFFDVLRRKAEQYRGKMRVHFHEAGLLEELRYRLESPAALLIVLPNGLVKLINALPFVCGDFRRQSLTEIWANFDAHGGIRASQSSFTIWPAIPVKRARCTSGCRSDTSSLTAPSAVHRLTRVLNSCVIGSSSSRACCRTCLALHGRAAWPVSLTSRCSGAGSGESFSR